MLVFFTYVYSKLKLDIKVANSKTRPDKRYVVDRYI
jgi:hypothetical protein